METQQDLSAKFVRAKVYVLDLDFLEFLRKKHYLLPKLLLDRQRQVNLKLYPSDVGRQDLSPKNWGATGN